MNSGRMLNAGKCLFQRLFFTVILAVVLYCSIYGMLIVFSVMSPLIEFIIGPGLLSRRS